MKSVARALAATLLVGSVFATPVLAAGLAGTVYSADETGNSISAIDLASGTVMTIPVAASPHNVDLTPDGGRLLATGAAPATPHGHQTAAHGHGPDAAASGSLIVLDPRQLHHMAARVIEVGSHPAHVVADRNGRAYVALSAENAVAVVDLAGGTVIQRIGTGAFPHGLRIGPDGRELYVANIDDGSVSVIALDALAEVARIPVGAGPVQVAFTPDGGEVYVSLRDENRVAVVDTSARQVIGKIDVGPSPIQLQVSPDGSRVFVANQGTEAVPNDTVSVIDTASASVVATIRTGLGAHGVAIAADGSAVFVTNSADDTVSVIDAATLGVTATFPVGDGPNGIAYGPPL